MLARLHDMAVTGLAGCAVLPPLSWPQHFGAIVRWMGGWPEAGNTRFQPPESITDSETLAKKVFRGRKSLDHVLLIAWRHNFQCKPCDGRSLTLQRHKPPPDVERVAEGWYGSIAAGDLRRCRH